jgi:hypothetical protein
MWSGSPQSLSRLPAADNTPSSFLPRVAGEDKGGGLTAPFVGLRAIGAQKKKTDYFSQRRKGAKGRKCHFDPFGHTQSRLREKSF